MAMPCSVLKPITFDGEHDTAETINGIREFNVKYNIVCGVK